MSSNFSCDNAFNQTSSSENTPPSKKIRSKRGLNLLHLPPEVFEAFAEKMDFHTLLNFNASCKAALHSTQWRWARLRQEQGYTYKFAMASSLLDRSKYVVAHVVRKFLDASYQYGTTKNPEYWSTAIQSLAKNKALRDLNVLLAGSGRRKKVDSLAHQNAGEAILKAQSTGADSKTYIDLLPFYEIAVKQGMLRASLYALRRYDQIYQSIDPSPEVSNKVVNIALEAAKYGEYDALELAVTHEKLSHYLSISPESEQYPPFLGVLGDKAMETNSFDEAIQHYNNVLKSYEDTQIDISHYLFQLLHAYSQRGNHVKALECYEKLLARGHKNEEFQNLGPLYLQAAFTLFADQQYEKALTYFRKINLTTISQPLGYDVIVRSAYSAYQLGKIQYAMKLYYQLEHIPLSDSLRALLQSMMTDFHNQYTEADKLYQSGNFMEAIALYAKLRTSLPEAQRKSVETRLVMAYYKVGMNLHALTLLHRLKPEEHSDEAKEMLTFFAGKADDFFEKAKVLFQMEDYSNTLKFYEILFRLNFIQDISIQDKAIILARISHCYYKTGNIEQTIYHLNQIANLPQTTEMKELLQPILDDAQLQQYRAKKPI